VRKEAGLGLKLVFGGRGKRKENDRTSIIS
jgi:hypothetical protein